MASKVDAAFRTEGDNWQTLSPKLITDVSSHPNIAGMKDTSSEDISIYTNAVPAGSDFYILSGTIEKFFKGLEVGAIGGVLYGRSRYVVVGRLGRTPRWLGDFASRGASTFGIRRCFG